MIRFSRSMVLAAAVLVAPSVARATTIDFTTIADGTYASIVQGQVTVTGSSSITSGDILGFRGLGVLGGTFPPTSDLTLDTGETMTVDYGELVTNYSVTVVDVDPVGNVTFRFVVFNGAVNLGTFAIPLATMAPQTFDLFVLSGGLAITALRLEVIAPSAPAGLQIQATSFDSATAVPEPATLLLVGAGATAAFWRKRRLRRVGLRA